MGHRIDVLKKLTATSTDVLSGTSLDPLPSKGIARVYAASTVNTATVEIEPSLHPSPTGVGAQAITLRGNGEIRAYDPHWETEGSAGEKLVVGLGGTTGTTYIWVSYLMAG